MPAVAKCALRKAPLMSYAEVLALTGVCRMTLRRWIASGFIPRPVVANGPTGKRLWSRKEVEEALRIGEA